MNGFYTRFLNRRLLASANLHASTALRCMLLRSTGSYSFNPDHDYVADIASNGGVEISVASYARQTLTNVTATIDDSNNRTVLDFDNIAFGALESGQTVSALVFYEHVTNDSDSPLIAHIDGKFKTTVAAPAAASTSGVISNITQDNPGVVSDTAHGLVSGDKIYITGVVGMTQVNNIMFTVTYVDANSFSIGVNTTGYTAYGSAGAWTLVRPVYVDPLKAPIAADTAVTINAQTGTVTGAHAKGDRTMFIRSLSGTLALADTGIIQSTMALPAVLGGGNFNFNVDSAGFYAQNGTAP